MSWSTAALILKPLHETSAITHCRKKKGNQAKTDLLSGYYFVNVM